MPSVGSTPTTTSPAQQTPTTTIQSTQQLQQQQQQQQQQQSITPTPSVSMNNNIINNNNNNYINGNGSNNSSSSSSNNNNTNSIVVNSRRHTKLQQQHSLPLQLQYQHYQPQVVNSQPSPAGTFINQAGIINSSTRCGFFGNNYSGGDNNSYFSTNLAMAAAYGIGNDDISSSGESFSSVDTNQTLLNTIATAQHQQHQSQQQQQQTQHQSSKQQLTKQRTASSSSSTNRSYRTKYSQYMIITPAVSIDRDFEQRHHHEQPLAQLNQQAKKQHHHSSSSQQSTSLKYQQKHNEITNMSFDNVFEDEDDMSNDPFFNNGNIFRMSLMHHQSAESIDSGNSSDSNSFRSNYNPYLHTSRQHLLPKSAPHFYNFSSWRWCTLICAAMRCFGAGGNSGGGRSSNSRYTSTFENNRKRRNERSTARPPYRRSCSTGARFNNGSTSSSTTATTTPQRRLHYSDSFTAENAFEHFSASFTPRKTRDHLNNIMYEL